MEMGFVSMELASARPSMTAVTVARQVVKMVAATMASVFTELVGASQDLEDLIAPLDFALEDVVTMPGATTEHVNATQSTLRLAAKLSTTPISQSNALLTACTVASDGVHIHIRPRVLDHPADATFNARVSACQNVLEQRLRVMGRYQ